MYDWDSSNVKGKLSFLTSGRRMVFIIAKSQQQTEKIIALGVALATLGDEIFGDRGKLVGRLPELAPVGQGQGVESIQAGQHRSLDAINGDLHGLSDLIGVAIGIGTEERARDDQQSQTHHLRRQIDGGADLPRVDGGARERGHLLGIGIEPGLVEWRLHHPPVAKMDRLFVGQETGAENLAQFQLLSALDFLDPEAADVDVPQVASTLALRYSERC